MADDDEPPDQPQPQPAAEILIQPEQMAGVWANVASISQTVHEFTLDFIRMDGSAPAPGRGIVVARVAFSPLMASQLADLLRDAWDQYADVPDAPEGTDHGPEEPEEPEEPAEDPEA
jgi:hypothetical protein